VPARVHYYPSVNRSRILFAAAVLIGGLLPAPEAKAQVVRKGLPGARQDTVRRPAPGLGTIDGFVGDSLLNPLQAAEVKILSTNVKVVTGPSGRFRISQVPAGSYVLVVRRAGYRPTSTVAQVVASDTLRPSYTLERSTTTLETATITAERTSPRLAEFEARRKLGFGDFMTEKEINQRNSVYTTDLLRKFVSINVSPSNTQTSGGAPEYFALSRREGGTILGAAGGGNGYCAMQVYVDDVRMPMPFNLDMLPSPRLLSGIEVYAGSATLPTKYNTMDSGCGVILVWTKDGY
jgi:hypothetical protein